MVYLVSSCLMGLVTRYDGQPRPSQECQQFLADKVWIPICPEQLGGLATPRPAAEISLGDGRDVLTGVARVVTGQGDVTDAFILGARQVLAVALAQRGGIAGVCLKGGSPSCGVNRVLGVCAALLAQHGFQLHEFD
ncbi:MAG: DUF523 domain-containing protein [Thermodesulfobacteriota bacterium]